jgi:hypothetical protein
MKISFFFISNFRGIFQFFSFPSGGMAKFFSNFEIISLFFHLPLVVCTNFFKNQKQKISIQISKNENFQFFHFKIFLWHKKILSLRLPNLLKICKTIVYLPLPKITYTAYHHLVVWSTVKEPSVIRSHHFDSTFTWCLISMASLLFAVMWRSVWHLFYLL